MRKYEFDNLKCLMIFLVVFGHLLEAFDGNISSKIYIMIYTFHIPVLVFISGYFFKFKPETLLKYTFIYFIWQTIYCIFDICVIGIQKEINYYLPYWIMWYLFSLILWGLSIYFLDTSSVKKMKIIILFTFLISMLTGFLFPEKLGYTFSISRTLVFLPYFLIGYYSKISGLDFLSLKNKNKKLDKKRLLVVSLVIIVCLIYFINNLDIINKKWLYGSYSYGYQGYNLNFRIICTLFSICMLIILKNIITKKKLRIISNIGRNTLTIYLLHGFIARLLRYKIDIFIFSEHINILLALIISILITLFFGIFASLVIKKIKANLILLSKKHLIFLRNTKK